ncbi:MAG: hypothetical protein RL085_581, partial [Actinomycetota bacterium]
THVLRGEDLLSSTPRQIALYNAMYEAGITKFIPQFGHLPFVMGEGNKKLSKRDPESNLFHHRDRGFIPEGLLNYLALLGWGFSADRDVFSLDEFVAAFDIANVNPNPARFDQKKADAINASQIRLLADDVTSVRKGLRTATDGYNAMTKRMNSTFIDAARKVGENPALAQSASGMESPVELDVQLNDLTASEYKALPEAEEN